MQVDTQTIGVIGVGLMGHGIALNIVKSGRNVLFLDHPGNQDTADLQALGATPMETGSEISKNAGVIITCVTGTPQVEDVLFRPDGVMAGLTPGTVVIDCSTAIPSSTLAIADKVAAAGGLFLDAPMTRTPKEAAEGRLNLIIGGDKALFDACLPLFQTYAENITYGGATGSGHTLKLIHNYVSLGFAAVMSEAAKASDLSGIPPEKLIEVLGSGGGAGPILDRFKPFLTDQQVSSFAFPISYAAKDMGYYASMAADLDAPAAVSGAILGMYDGLVASDHGDRFIPEAIDLIKR